MSLTPAPTPDPSPEVDFPSKSSILKAETINDLFPIFEEHYMTTALKAAIPSELWPSKLPDWFKDLHVALEAANKDGTTKALVAALKQFKDLEYGITSEKKMNSYWKTATEKARKEGTKVCEEKKKIEAELRKLKTAKLREDNIAKKAAEEGHASGRKRKAEESPAAQGSRKKSKGTQDESPIGLEVDSGDTGHSSGKSRRQKKAIEKSPATESVEIEDTEGANRIVKKQKGKQKIPADDIGREASNGNKRSKKKTQDELAAEFQHTIETVAG